MTPPDNLPRRAGVASNGHAKPYLGLHLSDWGGRGDWAGWAAGPGGNTPGARETESAESCS